jgi:hypothetical protein
MLQLSTLAATAAATTRRSSSTRMATAYARRLSSTPKPIDLYRLPAFRRTLSSTRPFFNANQVPPGVAASTTPPIPPTGPVVVKKVFLHRTRRVLRWGAYLTFSSVLGVGILTAAIFAHDAFTYNSQHIDRVPVNPLALNPERGGPKNLPIVSSYLNDEEDDEAKKLAKKPRLVIVGGGWGVRIRHHCCVRMEY